MKSLLLTASYSLLASAAPIRRLFNTVDTFDDFDAGKCGPVGVIFARGTFDQGNVGVWVGNIFGEALQDAIPGVVLQGVDEDAYPASLAGYLKEGGSEGGAKSLAAQVTAYNKKCPDSTIVVSGWSQGALVAHKGLDLIKGPALQKVAALAVFGDPWQHFKNTSTPNGIPVIPICFDSGVAVDPLCAPPPSRFALPTEAAAVVAGIAKIPTIASGIDQVKAATSLVVSFPGQLAGSFTAFRQAANPQDFIKLLLTPQHFNYGNDKTKLNGMVSKVAALPQVKAALAADKTKCKRAVKGASDPACAFVPGAKKPATTKAAAGAKKTVSTKAAAPTKATKKATSTKAAAPIKPAAGTKKPATPAVKPVAKPTKPATKKATPTKAAATRKPVVAPPKKTTPTKPPAAAAKKPVLKPAAKPAAKKAGKS